MDGGAVTHRANTLTEKVAIELCLIANETVGPPVPAERAWGIAEFLRDDYRQKARRLLRIVRAHQQSGIAHDDEVEP